VITEKEYLKRRQKFAQKLAPKSVAVLFSNEYKTRSNDTEFPFRQESNFYYLSGFKEDNAALVIVKKNKNVQTYLFVQAKVPELELWTGKRLGVKEAKKCFEVDKVFHSSEFDKKIKEYLKKNYTLLYDFSSKQQRVKELKKAAKECKDKSDLAPIVQKMRLVKSKAEIALIKKAIEITKEAHHEVISMKKQDLYEYQLQATIEYIFKKNGAYSDAYTTIVASGNNANTLHYIQNSAKLKKRDLILIDAGCEYEYYASDITRTIPVNGSFSSAQKELYQLVLDVQKKIIKMIGPGVMRSELHTRSEELLTEGMIRLGILKGKKKTLLLEKKHKKYYPHGIGHWMGIDVHDQAPYKYKNGKEIPLCAGMVLTIEPALYCDEEDMQIPKKYRGIGIRIEDNILVTADGYKNLSKEIVKEIRDLEKMQELE